MTRLGTMLVVGAHPDDETFTAGGLMAEGVLSGERVVCITATRGEEGSQDEQRWPPADMGRIREAELKRCLAVLGVGEHHWLGYIDGRCDTVDPTEATEKIRVFIEEVRPDSVLTFGPDGMTGHSDHKCVSSWTTAAFAQAAKPGARLYYATQTGTRPPTFAVSCTRPEAVTDGLYDLVRLDWRPAAAPARDPV